MRYGDFKRMEQLAAFVLCLAIAISSWADSSALDPTFGNNGRVSTNLAGEVRMGALHGAVLQPDGKLVLAGRSSFVFAVARLDANGTPDPGFNGNGQASVSFGDYPGSSASAVALQTDSKLVAVGSYGFGPNNVVAVARFLPNGTLDATFNGNGTVTTAMPDFVTNTSGTAVVIQADGRIVVAASGDGGSALIGYNPDGSLDTTFGAAGSGIVRLNGGLLYGLFWVTTLAVQPDGKLVVAGTENSFGVYTFGVARFTSNGMPDPTFNGTGVVSTPITSSDQAHALALQNDGRIVVAGEATVNGTSDFAVARYNSDGSLDTTFGVGGKVTTPIGDFADIPRGVGVLADGRIVVAGTGSGALSIEKKLALARFTSTGTLDPTLAGTGIVTAKLAGGTAFDSGEFLVVQPDGKVIVGGSVDVIIDNNGFITSAGGMIRYLGDGSRDPTFGKSGKVLTTGANSIDTLFALSTRSDGTLLAAGSSDGSSFAVVAYGADGAFAWSRLITGPRQACAVLEQPDGKIVLAGSNGDGPSGTFTVVRLSSDGSLDTTFNGTGRVDTLVGGLGSIASAAALQSDGKIVVVGSNRNATDYDFALARYNPDGSLDATFGSGGQVSTAIGTSDDGATAVALQKDGKIVAAGHSNENAHSRLAVARYLADGTLDPSFGIGGKAILAIASPDASPRAVVVQDDGRIVLAGIAFGANPLFVVARLNADGSPDPAFGPGGSVLTDMGATSLGSGGAWAMALLPDGRILASGGGAVNGQRSFALARYLPNGSLDPTFGIAGRLHILAPGNPQTVAPYALTLQSANRAVLGGVFQNISPDFDLVRVFTEDTIPPDTQLLATPPSTSTPSVSFSFTGSDAGGTDVASFECAIDGGPFLTCASPASYTGLAVGSRTFQVRARDGAGNVDPTPASYTWNVIPGPQAITFDPLPPHVITASPFAVSATGGDSGNAVVFSSLTPGTCSSSGTNGSVITLLTVGTCTIAADQAGNASYLTAPEVTRSFDVFANGFTLTVSRSGNGSGRVASTPLGIDCGAKCDWTFAAATTVTLVATPAAGSVFVRWTGACSGSGPCNVPIDAAKSVDATFADFTKLSRLVNISTRGQVQTDFDVMIGGFVISGSTPKTVVIRALGPTLALYGVLGTLANPQLRLVRSSDGMVIASNDDWSNAANAATIAASGLAPSSPSESAIYTTLQPDAYTAIVWGVGGGTGVGLVEVYEIDHPEIPFINISTRGKVLTDFDVMIGGFVIGGSEPQTVVVRGIGPSLASFGISRPLSNPKLVLVSMASQTAIASNDDWGSADNAAAIQSSGFAPSDPKESAIYITLQPGAYTAILSGVDGGTGTGLVEVYVVGP
jgi:uncharacterized delta-60 repeat protein